MSSVEDKITEQTLFSKDMIKERFADVYSAAAHHCASYNSARKRHFGVDRAALLHTVWAAYDDIARYKLYHLDLPIEKKSNAVKRAAYFTKWILKNRPLVALDVEERRVDDKTLADDGVLVNSFFALRLSTRHLMAEGCPRFTLTDEKWYEFLYDFMYRELNGDALITFYQLITDAARKELFKNHS